MREREREIKSTKNLLAREIISYKHISFSNYNTEAASKREGSEPDQQASLPATAQFHQRGALGNPCLETTWDYLDDDV